MFMTSSRETLNQVINDIADIIPQEPGLESLTVFLYVDPNKVDQWPIY